MTIERTQHGDVTVLRLEGDLDEGTVSDLKKALYGCLIEDAVRIVVNMAGVGYISYMGLGTLVESLRVFRGRGGDVKLVSVSLHGQHLFRRAGVKNVFATYDNEVQAAKAFQEAA